MTFKYLHSLKQVENYFFLCESNDKKMTLYQAFQSDDSYYLEIHDKENQEKQKIPYLFHKKYDTFQLVPISSGYGIILGYKEENQTYFEFFHIPLNTLYFSEEHFEQIKMVDDQYIEAFRLDNNEGYSYLYTQNGEILIKEKGAFGFLVLGDV